MRGRSFLVGVMLAGLLPIMLPSVPAWAVGGGTLDPTFGTGGKVLTDFGGQDMAYGMAVQADGKVVAAGFENAGGNYDFALARYNPDGTLDATFGAGGKVLTDVSGAGSYDVARAVAVQADGKIVVAGGSDAVRGIDHDFALARYNSDGTLDTTFGSGGKVLTDVVGEAYAVAVQSGGKIVAAGSSNTDFALVRYNRDGTLDSTFGTGGRVLTDFGGNDYAYAVAVRPDGKIVAAGFSDARGSYDFALARYNRDGTLDATFGAGGTVLTDVSGAGSYDDARAVAVQPNGKIVAVGGSNAVRGTDHDFALARYNRDGTLDATFGAGGKVVTDVSGTGGYDVGLAVAIQPNGKIVTAGASGAVRHADFALARYNRDGTLDATFGAGGKVVTDVSGTGSDNEAFAVAVQPDRKIVAVGASGTIRSDFALARYQP